MYPRKRERVKPLSYCQNKMDFPDNVIVFEPRKIFNSAIIRIDGNRLVYSFDKLVDALMKTGLTYHESVEYIDFNMLHVSIEQWPDIETEEPEE